MSEADRKLTMEQWDEFVGRGQNAQKAADDLLATVAPSLPPTSDGTFAMMAFVKVGTHKQAVVYGAEGRIEDLGQILTDLPRDLKGQVHTLLNSDKDEVGVLTDDQIHCLNCGLKLPREEDRHERTIGEHLGLAMVEVLCKWCWEEETPPE
jgi:hypothetical protein